jgi:hypothetical protein
MKPPSRWAAIRRGRLGLTDDERAYVVRWLVRWVGPNGRLRIYRPPFDEDDGPEIPPRGRP